jgi:hypothetical protein
VLKTTTFRQLRRRDYNCFSNRSNLVPTSCFDTSFVQHFRRWCPRSYVAETRRLLAKLAADPSSSFRMSSEAIEFGSEVRTVATVVDRLALKR